jgi:hypothetical protein
MLSGFRSERCPDIDRNPVRLIPGIRIIDPIALDRRPPSLVEAS